MTDIHTSTPAPPKFVSAEEAETVEWTVERGRFLLRGDDTDGRLSLFEVTTPAGSGPPFHYHRHTDKVFYVLEGAYDIQVGDSLHRAGPGCVVYGPRGIGHGFRNVGDTEGRMLFVTTPGGAELMFEGLAELLAAPGPTDRARIAELVEAHDTVYTEQPPATRIGGTR
ncbi:cupin domain-containing protein [Streptomyces lincolnensis]|uniref:cupin domain-containing protein n=1 Tax=Streptomyces lincolnensis TaxID=1915 RepID=UPI001E53BDFE|nr:cupin domain-containing protein [Streptomyces lincolnensis]MCD7439415.1 cupin domain-containing protein [Streptomyces lincolnensis]